MIRKFYEIDAQGVAGAAGGLSNLANPLGLALGGIQTVMGVIQGISGANNAKRLMGQRQAYKTPEEIFKILNATKSMASQGFDAFSLNYMTNQIDRSFSETVGAAQRAGGLAGDPNSLSRLLDQRIQGIMKVGAQNHELNTRNFSAYLGALDKVAANRTMEWQSKQDIIKDKLQAANMDKQTGVQNAVAGANAVIGSLAAKETANLYADRTKAIREAMGTSTQGLPQIDLGGLMYNPASGINPSDLPPIGVGSAGAAYDQSNYMRG